MHRYHFADTKYRYKYFISMSIINSLTKFEFIYFFNRAKINCYLTVITLNTAFKYLMSKIIFWYSGSSICPML